MRGKEKQQYLASTMILKLEAFMDSIRPYPDRFLQTEQVRADLIALLINK